MIPLSGWIITGLVVLIGLAGFVFGLRMNQASKPPKHPR